MTTLKSPLLWIIFGLATQSASAAVNGYQCLISEQLLLEENGALKRPPEPYLIGQRFAVDRNTGRIVGPEQGMWQFDNHKITVLARGNADNSFIVDSVGPSHGDGVHATHLRIVEFAPSKSKPFVVLSGSLVASGVCE